MSKSAASGVTTLLVMLAAFLFFAFEAKMFNIKLPPIAFKLMGGAAIAALVFFGGMKLGNDHAWHRANVKIELWCKAVGQPYDARKRETESCLKETRSLVSFKTDALAEKRRVLEEHETEQAAKAASDAKRAATNAKSLADATKKMDKQDGTVKDDRVGDDWFNALNELGGLRPQK